MGGAGNAEEPPDPKEHWSFVPRDTGPVPSFDATEAPPAASTAAPDDTAAPADAGMPSAPASAAPDDSTAPVTTAAPVPDGAAWVHNEIDAFILDRLHTLGQHPSPVAEPEKLLRRVTLDLTGLPPTLAEVDAFVADHSDAAYEAVVDRLLASKAYAETMTSEWLDISRYSDTDGFQYDIDRPAWPWRDWVLRAFDSNMRWDDFTIQQMAGDLLPDANEDTILATAFNRNHAIQGENGLLHDEFRDQYVTDRLETLGKGWLGLTLGCAKCHDHKYDPIKSLDFYRLYDCFNSIDEQDNGPTSNFSPTEKVASPLATALAPVLDARIAELQAEPEPRTGVINQLSADRAALDTQPDVRVMRDLDPKRDTFQLAIGRYDSPYGDPLNCAAPEFLPPFPDGAPANRLGLAQWIVMPDNPLTARVTANRFWLHHFGKGLVTSVDNFGMQTAAPDYLRLLDWLAQHFIDSGWDVKALHKLIVMSSTYRQSSIVEAGSSEEIPDPNNSWFARGPHYRLPAEVVRDLPLAVSGLLVDRFGGPSQYPYQPAGLWEELSWESHNISYPVVTGDGLYRRSVYSFWKKTLPPPFMTLFDAADRERSLAARELSITPPQALALLNGPQFIEAARKLAERSLADADGDPETAIVSAFRSVTSRVPNSDELDLLLQTYQDQVDLMTAQSVAVATLQLTGDSASSDTTPELAALTQVMRVLFNLSETITQE
jgi:hypothetical protein